MPRSSKASALRTECTCKSVLYHVQPLWAKAGAYKYKDPLTKLINVAKRRNKLNRLGVMATNILVNISSSLLIESHRRQAIRHYAARTLTRTRSSTFAIHTASAPSGRQPRLQTQFF